MNISSSRAFGNARKALIGLLLVGASCVSSQASAALVLFTLTGSATASFTLDQSPTPLNVNFNNFGLTSVAGTFQGAPALLFASFDTAGGFGLSSGMTNINATTTGANLFSGTMAAPTFTLGTYSLVGDINTFGDGIPTINRGRFSLTIASVDGAVPEPSTWMMMLVGFGLLGGAMRYGRNARAGIQTAKLV